MIGGFQVSDYIQRAFAERIGGINFGKDDKIYKFEKIKRAKKEAKSKKPDVELLDFGIGEPDDMAFEPVRTELKKQVDVFENRGYADNGIQEFKVAASKYMKTVFDADINPDTEVIHSIGAKPALAMLPLCFVNPGDNVLMTIPGYPVFGTHTKYLGGNVINLPLKKENNFFPELDKIDAKTLEKTKVLVINYPNNPTGKVADVGFFKEVISFAKENEIIIISDGAYSALVYDRKPLSFLSVEGAKDVGIEIQSLSKSFNMTGWRLAFVCGNEKLVKAYGTVKDNIDSGQFIAIQKAGIKALENNKMTEELTIKYKRRLSSIVSTLKQIGFNASVPEGTFYLYVEIPKGIKNGQKFESAEDFSQYLIKEKLISTVPFDDAGSYIRFSATFVAKDIEDENRVMNEFQKRLSDMQFDF